MSADTLLGRQLANFRLERVIGRGGMATVYYGWDVKLNRAVAIKLIDTRHRDDPAYAERFVREAQAVAAWRQDQIIQIYYAGDEDGYYYFAMEYIDGLDLGALLAQYEAAGELIPYQDVVRIGRAVATALDYAHKRKVIHRDVKPSNIMLDSEGRVILTDFGLAMDMYQGSLGEVFGSSHYVAPEQARSSAEAVPRSDLYSLGIVLYEMLTGVLPFDDPSPTTVALQHVTQEPPPPREANPNLAQKVEEVLLKALSKAPSARYRSGRALISALQKALKVQAKTPLVAEAPRSVSEIPVQERLAEYLQAQKTESAIDDQISSENKLGDDLIGAQLDEYYLDELLGQGGMARVYRAKDTNLERFVAIKVIDSPFQAKSDYVERFKREAQTIAQLEHPHIVRLYRYGQASGLLYMAMQYIEGQELGHLMAQHETISSSEICRITGQVCQALDYAHEQGVIHRDIKPSNILLNADNQVILADFGLALLTEMGTQGEIFGSPRYIAPEQAISSANVVPQSDLYALGVILYQLFTGRLPFEATDPLDLAMLHMSEPPRPPQTVNQDISDELAAVILKTLAKDPAERFQTGAALAEALTEAIQPALPEKPDQSNQPEPAEVKPTLEPVAISNGQEPAVVEVPVVPDSAVETVQPLPELADISLPLPPAAGIPSTAEAETGSTSVEVEAASASTLLDAPMPNPPPKEDTPQKITTSAALATLLQDRRLLVIIGIGIGVVIGLILALIVAAVIWFPNLIN